MCDQTTRHVIGLDLSCSWLNGSIHSSSTLFFLLHLKTLNLAGTYFNFSEISFEFGNFKTLTHLNLSYSMFSGKMPLEISHLSSLVSLDLSYNFGLLIETQIWNNLTQLRELLLDDTNMSLCRPNSLMNLSSSFASLSLNDSYLQGKLEKNILCFPSKQTLDLGFNSNLDLGSLPKCNWSCSSLKFLALSSISFLGELTESIGNLKYLKHLDLLETRFSGEFPNSMGNSKSMMYLDLSYCNFIGSIPISLGNLTQITHLDLHANKLTASIPTSLGNLTKLTFLDLSYNSFSGEIQLLLLNFSCF